MEINLWAVLAAAVAGFFVGGLWYSPKMFGPTWMKLLGWSKEEAEKAKKGAGKAMAAGFGTQLVTAYVFAYVLNMFAVDSAAEAIRVAIIMWVGFTFATQIGGVLWERKPFKLFVLNAGYSIVVLSVMGAVLTLMS